MPDAAQILFTWNEERLGDTTSVEIEDGTLRDGLQASFIRKPSVEEKAELIEVSARIGARHVVLGVAVAEYGVSFVPGDVYFADKATAQRNCLRLSCSCVTPPRSGPAWSACGSCSRTVASGR